MNSGKFEENFLNKYDPDATTPLFIHDWSEVKWEDVVGQAASRGTTAMPKGLKRAVLVGDPDKEGLCIMRFYYPPHYKVPPHIHPMAEHSSILEGVCYAAFETDHYDDSKLEKYTTGAWFSTPVGMPHYALTREEHCIIEIHVLGPWGAYFCNPDDHPHN